MAIAEAPPGTEKSPMQRPLTIAGALLLVSSAWAVTGNAWAEEPGPTMEVIENPEARDLTGSNALRVPEETREQGAQERQENREGERDELRNDRNQADQRRDQVREERGEKPPTPPDRPPSGRP